MKNLFFSLVCFLYVLILFSCAGNKKAAFVPVPDDRYFRREEKTIKTSSITETKDGRNLPVWLRAFINGGIEEVEKINSFNGKYVFIGYNEGANFNALNMWAGNFKAARDITNLAAERIERRMISSSVLYPDNEYGFFFETMIKNAYKTAYPRAVKEDVFWIKIIDEDNTEAIRREIYNFFILITIDKAIMQDIIVNMMEETNSAVTPTAAQNNSINRLRQTFFERF